MSQELFIKPYRVTLHFEGYKEYTSYVFNIFLQGPVQEGGLHRIQISTQNNAIAKYFSSELSES